MRGAAAAFCAAVLTWAVVGPGTGETHTAGQVTVVKAGAPHLLGRYTAVASRGAERTPIKAVKPVTPVRASTPKPPPPPEPEPEPEPAAPTPVAPSTGTSNPAPAPVGGTASTLNWAALAACESGGDPRAYNPAGPWMGLYQFAQSTWEGVGGVGDPRDASPEEQTVRAQILYSRSGDAPWPVCGVHLYD